MGEVIGQLLFAVVVMFCAAAGGIALFGALGWDTWTGGMFGCFASIAWMANKYA